MKVLVCTKHGTQAVMKRGGDLDCPDCSWSESIDTTFRELEVVPRSVADPVVDAAEEYARPFTRLGDAVRKYRDAVA